MESIKNNTKPTDYLEREYNSEKSFTSNLSNLKLENDEKQRENIINVENLSMKQKEPYGFIPIPVNFNLQQNKS